ncbi:MAG: dihydropteroate synthase [Caulobacteraceae bacterium]|nr:dihydropteroate synthase [Caulobacteraceae bacterium]
MGVVNVTPDSFSDGGRYAHVESAVEHGLRLVAEGADILDIGGESTRPGAEPVDAAEELTRVIPVIMGLRQAWDGPISIDTLKPTVARAAIGVGATIWNDVSALRGEMAVQSALELNCDVILMHMQGEPRTMQDSPVYDDVVAEVTAWLKGRADEALAAGIRREKISLDPGIGFGKTLEHNLALLRGLDRIAGLGFPVVLGVSRKRSIQAIDPTAVSPDDRLGGSLALALYGADKGAAVLRVHDVRETVQALKVREALGPGATSCA